MLNLNDLINHTFIAPSALTITQAFSLEYLILHNLGLRAFSPLTLGFYIPGRCPDGISLSTSQEQALKD